MFAREKTFSIPAAPGHKGLLDHAEQAVAFRLGDGANPLRFVITASNSEHYQCELGLLADYAAAGFPTPDSIFRFVRRSGPNTESFNAALVVPTGIGSEIGGHAGDAMPVARLLAEACDLLVTHPNVVNASDINELPENGLYVEGSILCRLLMGTLGLRKTRSNRVLVALDAANDDRWVDAAVNAVNAARATYGLDAAGVVVLDTPLRLTSRYTTSGRATGEIEGVEGLLNVLDSWRGRFDAAAIASVIEVPLAYHMEYFSSGGEMVNPWGGVEALLTHTASGVHSVPTAHAPMMESDDVAAVDPGVVDPRMAAEIISITFLQCVLKGMQRAPRLVLGADAMASSGVITAADVSCLVIPDGCVGLPTLAAMAQGIPVIAVRENRNLMRNDLTALPWDEGRLIVVDNYWEAAGVVAAMRAGIAPASVRRPLSPAPRKSR